MAAKTAISSNKKSTRIKSETNISKSNVKSSLAGVYKPVREIVDKTPLIGQLVAEFIGAFILTAAFIKMQGSPLYLAFVLVGIVLIVGGVSGAHLNPAVTVGAWATKRIGWIRALAYIVVQLLGATIAFLVLNTFLKESGADAATKLFGAESIVKGKEWYLFFTELLGATILALGVATAIRLKSNKIVAAFATGFGTFIGLQLAVILSSPLLTQSMYGSSNTTLTFINPAIAFSMNALSWNTWPLSIYVLAPVLGGIIGFALQAFFHSQDKNCECEDCK